MHSTSKKEASRQRLVTAAGRAFRKHGFEGIGVDGLAKGAKLTSGAFYFHFPSKLHAFVEILKVGLEDLKNTVQNFQTTDRRSWLSAFTAFYMGSRRTCDLSEGCALSALSSDVERAGYAAQSVYEAELFDLSSALAQGLEPGGNMTAREQAWALLAMLSGGVTMARAVDDPALSDEIAAAVRKAIETQFHARQIID